MAIQRSRALDPTAPIGERVAEILRNMNDPEVVAASMRRLRDRVAAYERQFGLPSSDIHSAIDRGDLVETLDVCRWIFAYDALARAESRERETISPAAEPR